MPPAISTPRFLRACARLLVLLCACGVGLVRATPAAFDLPAQPAAAALMAFARHAGAEVLFSFDELKKVPANAVAGTYEPEQAIELLLRGTGFKATRNATGKFVVLPERARKQTGEVRGRVASTADETPVAGAWIRLAGAPVAVRSRVDGTFLLPEVPAGRQELVVQAGGFAPVRIADVPVAARQRTELGAVRLAAAAGAQVLDEVVVNASDLNGAGPPAFVLDKVVVTPSRFMLEDQPGPVAATLTESDLLALPQLGEDLYRTISHLPGLAADDLTARFWVRGAPHEQVLARLDGVNLIEPFHLKDTDSSLSILDLETISRLDLYTGGFSAEYGNRSAGVLTMETDRPVRADPRTTLAVSLTGVRAANRGQSADGRSRWLVNARSGYPDLALSAAGQGNDSTIRPRYYDVMGKWEGDLAPGHVLSLHALHAGDRMFFRDAAGSVLRSRYGSDYAWARWRGEMGPLRGETVLACTRVSWQREGEGGPNRVGVLEAHDERELNTLALRQDWAFHATDWALLRGGWEVEAGRADYDYDNALDYYVLDGAALRIERRTREVHVNPRGETVGGFVSARVQPRSDLTFESGLRYDRNDYAGDSDFGPRLGGAWQWGRSTLRAAWGIYAQAQGLHRLSVADGETVFQPSERAEHRILSFERQLRPGVTLRLEGYERLVRRPQSHWENAVDNTDALPELSGDRVRNDPVSQRARGVELIAEHRANARLAWSASYAYARAEEILRGGMVVPRARDQRHTLYFDATYTPSPRWQFSLVWQYHTGWPTTEFRYTGTALTNGGVAVMGSLGPLGGLRLPNYARLDLRAQRRFETRHGTVRVYLDVFNALGKRNEMNFAYDYTIGPDARVTTTRINGDALLPFLPSVGVVWDF